MQVCIGEEEKRTLRPAAARTPVFRNGLAALALHLFVTRRSRSFSYALLLGSSICSQVPACATESSFSTAC